MDEEDVNLPREVAGLLMCAATTLTVMIKTAEPDDDVSFYVDTRTKLSHLADAFSPPGEPEDGYPSGKELAPVISLDAWRARNGR